MAIENKIGRLARNTGPARFFIPVGIVLIIFGAILFGFKTDKMAKILMSEQKKYENFCWVID